MTGKRDREARVFEGVLLFTAMFVLCCQVFGKGTSAKLQLIINLLWYFTAMGCVVFAGYLGGQYARKELNAKELWIYVLKYHGLYVLAGFGRFVIIDKGVAWDDLMRVAMFISVPKYAELFFTVTILLLASFMIGPVMYKIGKRKWLSAVVSIIGLALVLFPQSAVRYPIFAVWVNSDCFRCVPLLCCMGYYLFGMRAFAYPAVNKKKVFIFAGASTIYTLIMLIWHKKALVKTMEFPLNYWEILFPAGMIVLVLVGIKMYFNSREYSNASKYSIWLKTGLVILLVNILRGVFQVKKCGTITVFMIFALLWMISVVFVMFVESIQRNGFREWCKKHKKIVYVILYTIGFAAVFMLVYLPFFTTDTSFIWRRDAISQYFPKAMFYSRYIRECISSLLSGNFNFSMYDFSLGLGDGVPIKLEPLYWLHALFAPEDMEFGYTFVFVIRLYLSGLSLSALFAYLKKPAKIAWICSYIYCFSGYVVYECTRHAQFIVPFILFPVLVIAVEEILQKRKWYLGCILIAISMLASYYFLYMNTIALVIYFLIRFCYMPKDQKTMKNFWGYVGQFAGAYILGIGMGSMTIFTSLFNYFGSGRTEAGNVSAESLLYYKKDWIHDIYMNLIAPGEGLGYWMKLGMVPLCLFAIVMLFMRKNKKELKTCMTICLLGLLFPIVAYFMSGFGSVTNRWLHIFILVMVLAVAEAFVMIPTLTKKELGILFIAILPYFLMAMFYSRYNTVYYLKGLGMLLMTFVVIILSTKTIGFFTEKQMYIVMAVLVVLGLSMNGDMLWGENGAYLSTEYAAAGKAVNETETAEITACTDIEDNSFYRVTEAETGLYHYCSSAALDVNSVSYFNSTMNGLILDFDRIMGNGRSCVVYHSDYNNRTMLNALAAVKYYGALDDGTAEELLPYGYERCDTVERNNFSYAVFKTDDTLPLAYSYERIMSEDEFLQQPLEKRQEVLMKTAVVQDYNSINNIYLEKISETSGYMIEPKEILLEDVIWEENEIIGGDNGKITFKIDPVPNAEIYLLFKGKTISPIEGRDLTRLGVKSANGTYEYLLREEQNIYYMDMEKHMINFGYSKEGLDSITLQFYGRGNLQVEDWAIYCQPMDDYENDLANLTADTLENITMANDTIRGTISADTNKLLVFSIPYQKGWSAKIDGEEAPLVKTNIMYTGLEITPGEHEIELHYEMPGIKYGIIVTLSSMGIFALIVIGNAIRRKRKVIRR